MKIDIGTNLTAILGMIATGIFAIVLKILWMIDGILPHLERLIP